MKAQARRQNHSLSNIVVVVECLLFAMHGAMVQVNICARLTITCLWLSIFHLRTSAGIRNERRTWASSTVLNYHFES